MTFPIEPTPSRPTSPYGRSFPAERTALVTGAASERGIGRATATRLAREGWAVALLDLDAGAARARAAEIAAATGAATVGVGADVSDADAVDRAVAEIEAANLPPLLGLANIAGISSPTPFLDVTVPEWDRVQAVNLRGTFVVTQRLLPTMIANGIGRVVSISSVSAQRGGGTYSKVAYSAAKAGLLGFTRALAREVGHHGVTVNAVAPGPVDSDIMGGTLTDERRAALATDTLVGRIGTVEEIAALVGYLMGPDAGYITAATYDINGGLQVS